MLPSIEVVFKTFFYCFLVIIYKGLRNHEEAIHNFVTLLKGAVYTYKHEN